MKKIIKYIASFLLFCFLTTNVYGVRFYGPFGQGSGSSIIDAGTAQGQMAYWDDTASEWTYTETSELMWDDTNKRIGVGTSSPDTPLNVEATFSSASIDGIRGTFVVDNAAASYTAGTASYLSVTNTSGTVSEVWAAYNAATSSATGTGVASSLTGTYSVVQQDSANATATLIGQDSYILSGASKGLVTNAFNNNNWCDIGAGSTITNRYGQYIRDKSGAGTLTNQYGIYLEDMDGGSSTNYAIYSEGGTSYFAGDIGLGVVSPLKQIHIFSAAATVGAYFQTNSDTSYANFKLDAGSSTASKWAMGAGGISSSLYPGKFFISYNSGNTDALIIDGSNGYVGIGATTPLSLLHVNGTGSLANGLSFGALGNSGFYESQNNVISVAIEGAEKWYFWNSIFGSNSPTGARIYHTGASSTVPTLLPRGNDPNTGIGAETGDQLNLIAGGVSVMKLTEVGGVVQAILPLSNTPATPTLAFGAGADGFYQTGANSLRLALSGAHVWTFDASSIMGAAGAGAPRIINEVATSTNPVYTMSGDIDTGIGGEATTGDVLSLIAGGVSAMKLTEVGGVVQAILPQANTPTTPTLAFGDGDSGFYESADDSIQAAIAGTARWYLAQAYMGAVNSAGGRIVASGASGTSPTVIARGSDLDSGLGSGAADQLSLIAGGVQVMNLTEVGGVVQAIVPLSSTPSTPTLAFGDGDSGFYESADDNLKLALGGVLRWNLNASYIASNGAGGGVLAYSGASATVPFVTIAGDYDTGIGHSAADQLSLIAGGVSAMKLTEAGGVVQAILPQADTPATPTLAFGDADSGIYQAADNGLYFSIAGSGLFFMNGTHMGAISGARILANGPASFTAPSFVINNTDTNTGLARGAADTMSLVAGGVEGIRVVENTTISMHLPETTTPTAIANYGALYPKADNVLYFQDGAGVEHALTQSDTNYGEMYMYNGTTATTINVADQYHAVQGLFAQDHLNNFTMVAGSNGSGSMTSASGGAAININDTGHGLLTGDIVTIQSANHTGTEIATKLDDDNFTVPITFVGNETGYWQEGDYLLAGTGTAGTYRFTYNMSLTAGGNSKTYKFELSNGTTHIDESAAERKIGTGADIGAMGAGGLITIADGDRIFLIVKNTGDTTDLTLKHSNVSLNRL